MKPYLFFLALIVSTPAILWAQAENNIWAFGTGAGLDFNGGPPVAITTAIEVHEGSAAICDDQGRLLFYTGGRRAWNRNHSLMPNGTGLLPGVPVTGTLSANSSGSQQALIVPVPATLGKYYIFALQSENFPGRLYYSLVDMSLDNGLGDVVVGKKGVLLDNIALTEKMIAVAGDRCNVWLIVRCRNENQYRVYEITDEGIQPPVLYDVGRMPLFSYMRGVMKVSPDRKKLAVVCNGNSGIELYDFDPAIGSISNPVWIDSGALPQNAAPRGYYGCSFSPDNSRLYASIDNDIYQFDMNAGSIPGIRASKTLIVSYTASTIGDLKIGPDQKIYFTEYYPATFVNVIQLPNNLGTASQPMIHAIGVMPGTKAGIGLPNELVITPLPDTLSGIENIAVCFRDSVLLTAATGRRYLWNTGDTSRTITIKKPGTYTVSYRNDCSRHVDTYNVVFYQVPDVHVIAPGCGEKNDGIATVQPYTEDTAVYHYTWMDVSGRVLKERAGSGGDTLTGLATGRYSVRIRIPATGCDTLLYVAIEQFSGVRAAFNSDSFACVGQAIHFEQTGDTAQWVWDFGNGSVDSLTFSPVYTYPDEGVYPVSLVVFDTAGCSDTQEIWITVTDFDLQLSSDGDDLDPGSVLQLSTSADDPYTITGWQPVHLFHNQQALNQVLYADSTREYVVYGFSGYGCADSARVLVSVNPFIFIPSAFTPDGDGRNDFFRPVMNDVSVSIRSFSVFDRWGKCIWTGVGAAGIAGWDGSYEGRAAESGVYFYTIELRVGGRIHTRKGDVTLIR